MLFRLVNLITDTHHYIGHSRMYVVQLAKWWSSWLNMEQMSMLLHWIILAFQYLNWRLLWHMVGVQMIHTKENWPGCSHENLRS